MMQRKRVGLIVWGAIFCFIALVCLFTIWPLAIPFAVGGVLFLVFGIKSSARVSQNNEAVMADNRTFYGRCHHCGREVTAQSRNFMLHGRYPEGYVLCPICKKPLSKNAFVVMTDQPYTQQSNQAQVLHAAQPQAQQPAQTYAQQPAQTYAQQPAQSQAQQPAQSYVHPSAFSEQQAAQGREQQEEQGVVQFRA